MGHSVYDNSPFDSNRDGKISVSEQANIHETYYKESNYGHSSVSGGSFVLRLILLIGYLTICVVQPPLALIIFIFGGLAYISGMFR